MDFKLATVLMAICLFVGVVGGLAIDQKEVVTKEVPVEIVKNVSTEVRVEVPVPDASLFKDKAVEDFMKYVDDEELYKCDGHEYDYNEISVSKVYNDWTVSFDDEDYTVNFEVKLKYDEDDEESCKKSFDVEAFYEEDEDVEFTVD